MDPKRLLLILFPFVTLILVGLSMLIFNVVQQYRSALEKENIADQIVTDVFERRLVGYEYLVTPGERAAAQWFARQEALEKFVVQKEPLFQLPEEKQQLTVVKSALQESRATFEAVVRTFTAADSGSPALQGQKARFSSQLTIKSEESVSAAARLKTLNAAGAEKALGRVLNLFLLASATFMVVLLVCFAVVWHNATVLERRKARDDAILGSVGDGVFAVDPNGRVILFNRAAQTLTGYTYAEAIGKPYDKILSFYHELERLTLNS